MVLIPSGCLQAGPVVEIAAALAELSEDFQLAGQMAEVGILHPVATLLKQSPPRSVLMSSAITLAWNALEASPEALLKEPRALQSEDWRGEDDADEEGLTDDDEAIDAIQDPDQAMEALDIDEAGNAINEQGVSDEQQVPDSGVFSEADQGLSMREMLEEKLAADGDAAAELSEPPADQEKELVIERQGTGRQPLKVRNVTTTADMSKQKSLKPRSKERKQIKQSSSFRQGSSGKGSQTSQPPRQDSFQALDAMQSGDLQQVDLEYRSSSLTRLSTSQGDRPRSSSLARLSTSQGDCPRSGSLARMSTAQTVPSLDLRYTTSQAAEMDRLGSELQGLDLEDLAEEDEAWEDDPIDIDANELGERMRSRRSQMRPSKGRVTFPYEDASPLHDIDAEPAYINEPTTDQNQRRASQTKGRPPVKTKSKKVRPATAGTDTSKTSSTGRRRMVRSDSEGSGWASHSGGGVAHALADAISQLLQWAMREGRFDADRILASDAMSLALVLAQQSAGHQGEAAMTLFN